MENINLSVDKTKWLELAQTGELEFHKRSEFRKNTAAFLQANNLFFTKLGFRADQFSNSDAGGGAM